VNVIDCFDISHLSGTNIVGSMVQFKNGKPYKTNYRRFKVQTVDDNDDFRSMQEIVHRRYKRLALAKIEDPTATLPFPDLIIIDGGAQQLRFAKEALDELDLDIPIIGLAKKQEELYFPKKSRTSPI